MSAAPTTKTGMELGSESTPTARAPLSSSPSAATSSDETLARRNALQALLAFSSLHAQVRERRDRNPRRTNAVGVSQELIEAEQFVLDEVLQLVAERALAITGADGVAIALAEGEEIVCRGSAGIIAPDPGVRLDPNAGLSGACFRTGKLVRCDDIEIDSRVNLQVCRRLGARSMLAVPLCGRTRVVGLLEVFSVDAYAFNDSDVRSLTLLAELILGALKPHEEAQLAQAAELAARGAVPVGRFLEETSYERSAPAGAPLAVSSPEEAGRVEDESLFRETSPIFSEALAGESSRPGLWLVAAVVLLAVLLAGGVWWRISRQSQTVAKASEPASASQSAEAHGKLSSVAQPVTRGAAQDSSPPEGAEAVPQSGGAPLIAATPGDVKAQKLAVLPSVTGVRHWSSNNSSTVVIDLQDQVQYEAHRLTDPDRIYFDLHDTALGTNLSPGKVIEVDDPLLARVRVAQLMVGVTRIVLETRGGSNFSVSLEPNPYRLVVQIRAIGAGDAESTPRPDLFPAIREPRNSVALSSPASGDDLKLRARIPKFRIVLDAGHGGWDLGSVGRKGLLEKDLVFDISQRLGRLLENRLSCEVIYTRKDDSYVPLDQRADVANQSQADLFVSIHANYSNLKSARGVETYYTNFFAPSGAGDIEKRENGNIKMPVLKLSNVDLRDKVEESRKLAAAVQHSLHGTLAQQDAEIRDRGVREASFVVLTGTTMPAILAEVSFVSSPDDESSLKSATYRQQIAEALYKGIARYEASARRVKLASASARPTEE